ncbi:MAG: VOC family protein [Desulfobacteraceae bacterium]|nr:MAG: VOC family protein [Desulfobacteraceae bacterium]
MIRVKRIEPLVIAVKSLEKAIPFFKEILGAQSAPPFPEDDYLMGQFTIGESMIELLEPVDPNGPVAKFLERKGEGVYAVNIQVEDLDEAIAELQSRGLKILHKRDYEPPQSSLKGTIWTRLAFIHPRETFGVLFIFGETKD